MTDLLKFIEKLTVNGEPFKLTTLQNWMIETLKGKKIMLRFKRSNAACWHAPLPATENDKPFNPIKTTFGTKRQDAFQTSSLVYFEHWSEFGNYEMGTDTGEPSKDYYCIVASAGKDINVFWYIAQGMEILWVDLPHFWPKDMFEWHDNETWWLRYVREFGIDITKYFPIGVPE